MRVPEIARPRRRHYLLAALAWTTFAVYGSLVPLRYQAFPLAEAVERFRNLPPMWFGMGTRADWVANILLFVPLTFLWMATLTCDRGRAARFGAAAAIVPLAMASAVALEFTQIFFPGRTVSRNDIVAESAGAMAGVLLWLFAGQPVTGWLRSHSKARQSRSRLIWLLQAYLGGFLIFSVIPLDLTISITDLYDKYQRGQVKLVPFFYSYDSIADAVFQFSADVMVFIPIGAWAALTQSHLFPTMSRVVSGTITGAVIAVGLELTQLLVVSRYTDSTDVVLGGVGAGVGAWLVERAIGARAEPKHVDAVTARARRFVWPPLAIVLYTGLLLFRFWYPFEITRDRVLIEQRFREGLFRVPLMALYQGSEFNAIQQVVTRLLLFGVLGALWAWFASKADSRGLQRLILFVGLAYCVSVAVIGELVQVLMPNQVADATEVVICAIGSLIGLLVARDLLRRARNPAIIDRPRH